MAQVVVKILTKTYGDVVAVDAIGRSQTIPPT